ncbi:MAG: biotin/lipoyl-containing protein [Acidobacteriota bacterium]
MEVLFEKNDITFNILSPGVGVFESIVKNGEFISAGSAIGNLFILGLRFVLTLPQNISGIVDTGENNLQIFPVGYKTPILSLSSDIEKQEKKSSEKLKKNNDRGQSNEMIITAFTTGIFYTRPSPDSPPYISPGSIIHKGNVLGLIEVMKSFNQIVFTGDGKNESGKVLKIVAEDSSEVSFGDPLVIISVDEGGKN